jgi:predicted nucleic acid-binding protein
MNISTLFAGIKLLGVETSPFIYFVERHPIYLERIRTIFQQVEAGYLEVITSVITLTEVLVMPLQTNNTRYEFEYREMLLNTAHITTLEVSTAIAEQAAYLRVKYRLRTPDAIHVATALLSRCDAFLTNDHALKRITEIRILVLDDFACDSPA